MSSDTALSVIHPEGRVRALFHGHLLADSGQAVQVRRPGEPDRWFFPQKDVEMVVLRRNDHAAFAPGAGSAAYFTIHRDGLVIEEVAWTYEIDNARPREIQGMITFNTDEVKIEAEAEPRAAEESRSIRDYILHTDSGSGRSQEAPWEPTVGVASDLLGESDTP